LFYWINFVDDPRVLSRRTSLTFLFNLIFKAVVFPYFHLIVFFVDFHVLFELEIIFLNFFDRFHFFLPENSFQLQRRMFSTVIQMLGFLFFLNSRKKTSSRTFSVEFQLASFFVAFENESLFFVTNIASPAKKLVFDIRLVEHNLRANGDQIMS